MLERLEAKSMALGGQRPGSTPLDGPEILVEEPVRIELQCDLMRDVASAIEPGCAAGATLAGITLRIIWIRLRKRATARRGGLTLAPRQSQVRLHFWPRLRLEVRPS